MKHFAVWVKGIGSFSSKLKCVIWIPPDGGLRRHDSTPYGYGRAISNGVENAIGFCGPIFNSSGPLIPLIKYKRTKENM